MATTATECLWPVVRVSREEIAMLMKYIQLKCSIDFLSNSLIDAGLCEL